MQTKWAMFDNVLQAFIAFLYDFTQKYIRTLLATANIIM